MRLVSWNTQWGRGVDGRVDLDRVMAELQRLGPIDVLMLQEVADGFSELPGAHDMDQFSAWASRLHGYDVIEGVATDTLAPDGGRRRFGNLIASRLPVLQVFRHLLPWPADGSVMTMQRVALEVTVQAHFGPLRVTTTHLEYYSALQRRAQIERLRQLHVEASQQGHTWRPGGVVDGPFAAVPRGVMAILAGDFNCEPTSPEFVHLLDPVEGAQPYVDAWAVGHPGKEHPCTVGLYDRAQWPDGPRTFDFMLVSADLSARVAGVGVDALTQASDHQPIWLDLH